MDQGARQVREKNPRDGASIFSIITFFYTYPLFKKGYKQRLQDTDIYDIVPWLSSSSLGNDIEDEWYKEGKTKGKDKPSLLRVLFKCFAKKYIILGIIQLTVRTTLVFVLPNALGKFVSYFQDGQTEMTRGDLYKYATIIVGLNLVSTIYNHNYQMLVVEHGIKIRTALAALVFRKALRLGPIAFSSVTMGRIVTFITKDVFAFEGMLIFLNDIFVGFLQIVITCYIIYARVGPSVFIGLGFLLLLIPLQVYLGKKQAILRISSAKKTDERLQLTTEVLSSIKVVKMFTWESFFEDKVNALRKSEINRLALVYYLKCIILIMGTIASSLSFFFMILTYVWLGNYVNAELVYFIQTCFSSLRSFITISIPYGITQVGEVYASIKRLQAFMDMENLHEAHSISEGPKAKVCLTHVTSVANGTEVIKDVSLSADKGLNLITGNVGSGKSSILKVIMGEYPATKGERIVQGSISYASQEPWLFPSSIRQNILFGQPYNERRYNDVIRVCALRYDFSNFEHGDQTIVGDRGLNLSKGQQARINLARAVYKDSDIYLFDDCLSALDNHVNLFVYRKCIMEYLADKIVIMVTHNVNHFKLVYGNNILTINDGKTLSLEQQKEIMDKRITYFIDDVNDDRYEGEDTEIRDLYGHNDDDENSKLLHAHEQQPTLNLYHEKKEGGKVKLGVYLRYYKYAGGFFSMVSIFLAFALSTAAIAYSEKLVSKWVNVEPKLSALSLVNETNTTEYEAIFDERNSLLSLYCVVIISGVGLVFVRTYLNFYFCLNASKNLHKSLASSVLKSFMEFFDGHYIGNIINRFSKDLYAVDETIPGNVYEIFRNTCLFLGTMYLIASVNTTFIIPAVFLTIKLYFIRRYYMNTGRDIKRLESASRSPMLGYMNATLDGITTVRASENQSLMTQEFDKHQDLFTSSYYMTVCTTRAFGFILDMLSSSFVAVIVLKFVFIDTGSTAGDVGLALSQAMGLTGMLQWMVRQYSDMESNMTAIERVLEYMDVKTEDKQSGEIRDNWPSWGVIEYNNVNLTYSSAKQKILKDVSFTINSKEKIGIVGRTGAGKSSLISSLFRLYNYEGRIMIDGVDTKTLSLDFLRSHIAIIPQDPVVFSGSVRSNIDPQSRYTDDGIWDALAKVGLKDTFNSLEESITENGSNYSSGQKQLLCLARALVTKCKIVVLDEATANMDPETCATIQNIIKNSFRDCTVLTIAHRLNTIIGSDKVLVVDDGQVIEFDTPMALKEKNDSLFNTMIQQSGLHLID